MDALDPAKIQRPDPSLFKYYVIMCLLTGPACIFTFWPMFFKYETLKYRFEDDGMSMTWGFLFRHEIHLTYRRIQDIHLTRNIIQRWLGLATVSIQTAAGSASPQMDIEGILQPEKLRDYLYAKMRGARGLESHPETAGEQHTGDEALTLLREIRDLLRRTDQS